MRTVIPAILCSFLVGCVGSRHKIRLDKLEYPVSMTGQIYGSDHTIKAEGAGLAVIDDIEVTHTYWSLFYSLVPLGDTTAQVQEFNRAIAARQAQGVIYFEIENSGCGINNMALLVLPAVLPFFPGCSSITFRGKLVYETP
ncbi:MAG: hypothetical protein N2Z22_04450 [Turneriella sp.]|nr:hypothetical protein [Turneriella sp.]